MKIIFCDSVIDNKTVEPDYHTEFISAKNNGFNTEIISFEALEEGNIKSALKYMKSCDKQELAIYRGWMMRPKVYEAFYQGLLMKNIILINNPVEYNHCHYLPNSYDKIINETPKSNWTKDLLQNNILDLVKDFGNNPIIVKDFVKSEKHHWKDACFIPNASDKNKVQEVTNKFLELRGSYLNEGLVFREFVELEFLTDHSKSGMPLTKEFRLIFLNKELVQVLDYWDEGVYDSEKPDIEFFKNIANKIESNFFTMDVAKKKDGNWIIMELGDGQVAGLPDHANTDEFYCTMRSILKNIPNNNLLS
ncbi:ATP-grasp domain-containing protein [Winogradskyella sp. SYSU M77433]|uniref:ATP-grasp domain-containing protein n=1 Tax=Winogradskyella sp. SYSU M77433 TaxID=3042722 RepID=UPI00248051A0|nr:ATP-grasp domain-containing protein [Winogradskyella sp. SYSU M77433]MDH7914352.1 ATP-grasp domain-containing protein [Winogradskyella sp. SYSU M77433]